MDADDREVEPEQDEIMGRSDMTPEDREAAARPIEAGEYWKEWKPLRAAQRLFSDEVARIDEACRNKKNKKDLGKRTAAIHKWWKEQPESRKIEAENAATKWNADGASNKEKMSM